MIAHRYHKRHLWRSRVAGGAADAPIASRLAAESAEGAINRLPKPALIAGMQPV
jgi:hypothetical protein